MVCSLSTAVRDGLRSVVDTIHEQRPTHGAMTEDWFYVIG